MTGTSTRARGSAIAQDPQIPGCCCGPRESGWRRVRAGGRMALRLPDELGREKKDSARPERFARAPSLLMRGRHDEGEGQGATRGGCGPGFRKGARARRPAWHGALGRLRPGLRPRSRRGGREPPYRGRVIRSGLLQHLPAFRRLRSLTVAARFANPQSEIRNRSRPRSPERHRRLTAAAS